MVPCSEGFIRRIALFFGIGDTCLQKQPTPLIEPLSPWNMNEAPGSLEYGWSPWVPGIWMESLGPWNMDEAPGSLECGRKMSLFLSDKGFIYFPSPFQSLRCE